MYVPLGCLLSLGAIQSVSSTEFPVPLIQYEIVHIHVKMNKHILIFVLATGRSFLQDDFDVVCAVYFSLFLICPITSYSFLILKWPGSL